MTQRAMVLTAGVVLFVVAGCGSADRTLPSLVEPADTPSSMVIADDADAPDVDEDVWVPVPLGVLDGSSLDRDGYDITGCTSQEQVGAEYPDAADYLFYVSSWWRVDSIVDREIGNSPGTSYMTFMLSSVNSDVVDEHRVRIRTQMKGVLGWGLDSGRPVYVGLNTDPYLIPDEGEIFAEISALFVEEAGGIPVIGGTCGMVHLHYDLKAVHGDMTGLAPRLLEDVGVDLIAAVLPNKTGSYQTSIDADVQKGTDNESTVTLTLNPWLSLTCQQIDESIADVDLTFENSFGTIEQAVADFMSERNPQYQARTSWRSLRRVDPVIEGNLATAYFLDEAGSPRLAISLVGADVTGEGVRWGTSGFVACADD